LSKFLLKIKWQQIKQKPYETMERIQSQEGVSLACIEDGKVTSRDKQQRNELSVGKWNLVAG